MTFRWRHIGDVRGRRLRGAALRDQEARAAAGLPNGGLRAIGDFSLGDRVRCARRVDEGTGRVVAISNDLADGSGATKLFPTLYVELDSGGGDWFHATDVTKVTG